EGYPKLFATVTGERKYDVYMGIDDFGRGTYGGGQAGYGESDPNPKRTLKSTVLDVEELADQMELGSKFYVMGYSMEGRQFGTSLSTSLIGPELHSDSRGKSSLTVVKGVNNVWKLTTPKEVLSIFLVDLRVMDELQLKRVVRNIVLTVPVSFSQFSVDSIERACAMAGLFVLRLMPEPTAAALLYGQHQQQTVHDNMGSGSENIAMIFNMGAGYCDACVTSTTGGVHRSKPCLVVTLEEKILFRT
ncbi:hypothetical protein GIB67_031870, partial [Kingdonia uniflora]